MQGNNEVYIMRGPFQGQNYFSLAEHVLDYICVRLQVALNKCCRAAVVLWVLAPKGRRSGEFTRCAVPLAAPSWSRCFL